MALGKIKADTLEHSTAGSIATNYVVEGSSKAWMQFDATTNTVNESFGTSSLTDNGTGRHQANLSNSFTNDNFVHHNASTASTYNTTIDGGYIGSSLASLRVRQDGGTHGDTEGCTIHCIGDLA